MNLEVPKNNSGNNLETEGQKEKFVLDLINSAEPIEEVDFRDAPFLEYKRNTDEQWAHVPDEEIREFLNKKTFLNTEQILIGKKMEEVCSIHRNELKGTPFFTHSF